MKTFLICIVFIIGFASCSDDNPVITPAINTIVKGSENMWIPVGNTVTYTYRSLGERDSFNLIKKSISHTRNLREFIGSDMKVTMPGTPFYAIELSPSEKVTMFNQAFGFITGIGFYQDASGKSTLLTTSDYLLDTTEADAIRLPENLVMDKQVQYAKEGSTYQLLNVYTDENTYWGKAEVSVIEFNSFYESRVFFIVKGKGIQRCDAYDKTGLVDSYILTNVKE